MNDINEEQQDAALEQSLASAIDVVAKSNGKGEARELAERVMRYADPDTKKTTRALSEQAVRIVAGYDQKIAEARRIRVTISECINDMMLARETFQALLDTNEQT